MQPISYHDSTVLTGLATPVAVSAANPLPVTLSGGIGGLSVAGTIADGGAAGAQFPVTVGGVDSTTGLIHRFNTDATGQLKVVLGGGGSVVVSSGVANAALANPDPVVTAGRDAAGNIRTNAADASGNQFAVGNVANNAADSGNPIKIGGIYSSATNLASLTVGARGDVQLDSFGNIRAVIVGGSATGADAAPNNIIRLQASTSNASASSFLGVFSYTFNGSTWDRNYKPRTSFKLPSSAASNNAANIKTTAGTIFSISGLITLAASTCWIKFFDTTGVPNPAALAQLYLFPLDIASGGRFQFMLPANGLYFATGIGVAIVANPADLDNTAIAAGQIQGLMVTFQ